MDSALIIPLVSAGTAGVFCVLFILGLILPKPVADDLRAERDYERQRANAERERADAAVAAAQGTRDVLAALQSGVELGRQRYDDARSVRVMHDGAARELPAVSEPGQRERDPA